MKRLLCMILACWITLSSLPAEAVLSGTDSSDGDAVKGVENNYEVVGEDSVGEMISNLLSEEQSAEAESRELGYGITSLVISEKYVSVTYFSAEPACIMVALYDEESGQMRAIGAQTVEMGSASVTLPLSGSLPAYFKASAFLLNAENYSPLCEKYTTAMYTRAMRDLLSASVSDYDEERVLNLDGNPDNNHGNQFSVKLNKFQFSY